jgi:hypothetical protein
MYRRSRKGQQLSIGDRLMNLPKSMVENLQKSWAEQFYQNIFLSIQEDRFANLYSNICSRPNKAVNMLVSLLILKELHGLTDDELMGALYFDYRYQYAMGISDFENDTFSINTLTNFRQRLMVYEAKENIDLLKLETEALSNKLADLIALDRSMARMDSFMMSSSCKKLTRLELVFKVVQAMVKALHKLSPALVPAAFQVYLGEQHQNEVLYHTKNTEAGSKLETQFTQAEALYQYVNQHPDWHQLGEYKRLNRLLKDQCIETEEGDLIPIEATKIASDSLQNPTDPDATYRNKGGEGHVGYVVNLVEIRDEAKNVGLILSYEMDNNTHSDAEFGQAFVESNPLAKEIDSLSADGAYYRQETIQAAKEKGIEINLSNMTGRKVDKDTLLVNGFVHNEQSIITHCPAGYEPIQAKYDSGKKVFTAKFDKAVCAVCPFQVQCPMNEQKKYNTVRFTESKLQSDTFRSSMNSERHKELSRFRAGVEGVVSALRRKFGVDDLPVRGFLRSKIWLNAKIVAYNFKMVTKYQVRLAQ